MAGEIIGKIYEAILQVVLWRIIAKRVVNGRVFWNEIPEGISVEPDFLIGRNKDNPTHFFFVTHSGASGNSHMKTWRNIGELCEAKSVLRDMPFAISVSFETIWKADLKKMLDGVFDGEIFVDDRPYGKKLVAWVHANAANFPGTQEEKAESLKRLAKKGSELDGLLNALEKDVVACVKKENIELLELWRLERARGKGRAPAPKATSIRRGLSKLMVFEDLDLGLNLYSGKRVAAKEIPGYVFAAGLAKRTIGRAIPCDEEIAGAVKMLSKKQVRDVCGSVESCDVLNGMFSQVRGVENVARMGAYVTDNFEALVVPDKLYKQLSSLHYDPSALVSDGYFGGTRPSSVWLFDVIMELIKATNDKANGYGYAQLAQEVADENGHAKACSKNARRFLLSPWGYMSEWTSRNGSKDIPEEVIYAVSCVLSAHLKDIGKANVEKVIDELSGSFVHNLIEAKICTYRLFEPLFELARAELPRLKKVSYRTCFAEKAGLSGAAGKTTVAQYKDVILNWQSAYGGHSNDKRKELCGRAVGLRYTWDAMAKKFKPRPGVNKLVLLLDGTWTQKDLNALVAAGWDEIYYPDEIDKLKASVLGNDKRGGVIDVDFSHPDEYRMVGDTDKSNKGKSKKPTTKRSLPSHPSFK